jgi:hypothetical protein
VGPFKTSSESLMTHMEIAGGVCETNMAREVTFAYAFLLNKLFFHYRHFGDSYCFHRPGNLNLHQSSEPVLQVPTRENGPLFRLED